MGLGLSYLILHGSLIFVPYLDMAVMTCDQHIVVMCTQCYHTEQHSHVIAIFMLNKCHPITWELCVKYYYMVAVVVSDVDHWWMQFLGVDVTGPWRFLCSKDRFD